MISFLKMDETKATIQYGCRLARHLEENLDSLANQPELLSRSCDEIIRVFSHVKERISYANEQQQQLEAATSGAQEWLRSGHDGTQAMEDLVRAQAQLWDSRAAFGLHGGGQPGPSAGDMTEEMQQQEQAQPEVSVRLGDDLRQAMTADRSGRGSSSLQRQRRRRDEGEKRTVRVPAPRMGNTEIPPEDCYTWRKYGQKDILNSKYPRSYFRCTHQKLYKCPAKKQVQRLDDAPDIFEITYRGEHTCHLSSTAPSMAPPPSLQVRQDMIPQAATILHPPLPGPASTSLPLSNWLSMDIIRPPPAGEGTSAVSAGMQMHRNFGLATAGTSISGAAGPSGPRFGDYQPVADMADVMFNSGSSSNNSMDLIFSSMDDKWDSGDKKN